MVVVAERPRSQNTLALAALLCSCSRRQAYPLLDNLPVTKARSLRQVQILPPLGDLRNCWRLVRQATVQACWCWCQWACSRRNGERDSCCTPTPAQGREVLARSGICCCPLCLGGGCGSVNLRKRRHSACCCSWSGSWPLRHLSSRHSVPRQVPEAPTGTPAATEIVKLPKPDLAG